MLLLNGNAISGWKKKVYAKRKLYQPMCFEYCIMSKSYFQEHSNKQ